MKWNTEHRHTFIHQCASGNVFTYFGKTQDEKNFHFTCEKRFIGTATDIAEAKHVCIPNITKTLIAIYGNKINLSI